MDSLISYRHFENSDPEYLDYFDVTLLRSINEFPEGDVFDAISVNLTDGAIHGRRRDGSIVKLGHRILEKPARRTSYGSQAVNALAMSPRRQQKLHHHHGAELGCACKRK